MAHQGDTLVEHAYLLNHDPYMAQVLYDHVEREGDKDTLSLLRLSRLLKEELGDWDGNAGVPSRISPKPSPLDSSAHYL
ncbi:hypothetical protein KW805_04590 [Candidatus Pacearchaeota archaeon]|nr:hypothetical protein [Candidatus Pacearchaeota archaeon]